MGRSTEGNSLVFTAERDWALGFASTIRESQDEPAAACRNKRADAPPRASPGLRLTREVSRQPVVVVYPRSTVLFMEGVWTGFTAPRWVLDAAPRLCGCLCVMMLSHWTD